MQETQEMQVQSLGQEDPLEEDIATHSSILAWEIPRTEELDTTGPAYTKCQTRKQILEAQGIPNGII